jgi:hypothetical protein
VIIRRFVQGVFLAYVLWALPPVHAQPPSNQVINGAECIPYFPYPFVTEPVFRAAHFIGGRGGALAFCQMPSAPPTATSYITLNGANFNIIAGGGPLFARVCVHSGFRDYTCGDYTLTSRAGDFSVRLLAPDPLPPGTTGAFVIVGFPNPEPGYESFVYQLSRQWTTFQP